MAKRFITTVVVCLLLANAAGAAPRYKVVILRTSFPICAYGVAGGQQVGVVGWDAALWSGTAESYVDLNPTGFNATTAYGISGSQQVGYGVGPITGNADHALLWSGTAASYVDLNPAGFTESWAYGASGGKQVGYGWGPVVTGWYYHALLWSGTAGSCIDLHPAGPIDSWAYGISGDQQVGCCQFMWTGVFHALLWSGTAESCVDLHPPSGFDHTGAFGVGDGQQVGYGITTGSAEHALLWSGTAESCVDLNPTGFYQSEAHGVCNGRQVGWGYSYATGGQCHALLWSGTADSCIDLHAFVPPTCTTSAACGIDAAGNIVGTAGYSAVMWVPDVPSTPPTIISISAPLDPVPVNTAVAASASFSDPDADDTHTALWDWGDGMSTAGVVDEEAKTATGSHVYTAAGIYALTLAVTDAEGKSDEDVFQYVVVYDPAGGFTTGAGWIDSPAGAYVADPTLAGRASFAFVSRYLRGAKVPTGNTQFRFKAGDLDFGSDSYEWLVVNQAGTNAQYKGTGTVNGAGQYKFMLWAGDGAPDTFRIKIWSETAGIETTVYDNGFNQPIGGGSIVVHKE